VNLFAITMGFAIATALLAGLIRLFFIRKPVPTAAENWEQRNDLRQPSLEKFADGTDHASALGIDLGVSGDHHA